MLKPALKKLAINYVGMQAWCVGQLRARLLAGGRRYRPFKREWLWLVLAPLQFSESLEHQAHIAGTSHMLEHFGSPTRGWHSSGIDFRFAEAQ